MYSIWHTSHCGSTYLACLLSKSTPTYSEPTWCRKDEIIERYKEIDWIKYHDSLPFNTSALALYEWSPIAEELKTLDKKIVLNSMILKWDNIKKEFNELINF